MKKQFDEHFDLILPMNVRINSLLEARFGDGTGKDLHVKLATKDIMESFIQLISIQKKEIIKQLEAIHRDKWTDAKHCTCLLFAINKLKEIED